MPWVLLRRLCISWTAETLSVAHTCARGRGGGGFSSGGFHRESKCNFYTLIFCPRPSFLFWPYTSVHFGHLNNYAAGGAWAAPLVESVSPIPKQGTGLLAPRPPYRAARREVRTPGMQHGIGSYRGAYKLCRRVECVLVPAPARLRSRWLVGALGTLTSVLCPAPSNSPLPIPWPQSSGQW